jgi:hypothetical protein
MTTKAMPFASLLIAVLGTAAVSSALAARPQERSGFFIGVYSSNPPPAVIYVNPDRPHHGYHHPSHSYQSGYHNGYHSGYHDGFQDGHHSGYHQGHREGHFVGAGRPPSYGHDQGHGYGSLPPSAYYRGKARASWR